MFSRKESRKFVINPINSKTNWDQFRKDTQDVEISFQTLSDISPDKKTLRRRARDPQTQTHYIEFMSTSAGEIFIEESPCKKQQTSEVRFDKIPPIAELRETHPELFEDPQKEYFSFIITPEDIHNRIGAKRPVSQHQVVGHSAKKIFEAYGAIIHQETSEKLHLAHRHGWSLGGSQTKENLDPATAGSNYSTLLTIESPLKHLLKGEGVQTMQVNGTVIYHPLIELPMEIIYELSWGNARSAKVHIYPLEHRKPTYSEKIVAHALLKAIRSPEAATPPSPPRNYYSSNSCVKTLFSGADETNMPNDATCFSSSPSQG